jgi:hypothetical protein
LEAEEVVAKQVLVMALSEALEVVLMMALAQEKDQELEKRVFE